MEGKYLPATAAALASPPTRLSFSPNMPRFLLGDEQGQIKSLTYGIEKDPNYRLTTLSRRVKDGKKSSIQRLTSVEVGGSKTVRLIPSSISLMSLRKDDKSRCLQPTLMAI